MKLTKSKLEQLIKEELNEIGRENPQMQTGEPDGSGARQQSGTAKAFILDKFQDLYELWSEVEAVQEDHPRAFQYWQELGELIEKIEGIAELDDKRYFQEE